LHRQAPRHLPHEREETMKAAGDWMRT
jgi:hypothetical protein